MTPEKTPAVTLRPEAELLLYCARAWLGSEPTEGTVAFLRKEMDWEYLYRIACRHGMVPILYWGLRGTVPVAAPVAFLKQLRDHVHSSIQRNLFMTGELLEILSVFEAHRILAVPFKGPVLAASAHANLSLRQFWDLDILIRRRDVPRAKELLIAHGYRPVPALRQAQEAAVLRWSSHLTFTLMGKPLLVEIHWRIGSPYFCPSLALEPMWERLEKVFLGGGEVVTFCPEDLLLLLCAHGTGHCWERLGWVLDVARLISVQRSLDWKQVMNRARGSGMQRMLFLGLFLAKDFFGTALPNETAAGIRGTAGLKSLAAQVRQRLSREGEASVGPLERFFFRIKMMDGVSRQIRYCLRYARQVMTPTTLEWEALPLPDFLFPLYYAFRPARLIAKYALVLWKRVLP